MALLSGGGAGGGPGRSGGWARELARLVAREGVTHLSVPPAVLAGAGGRVGRAAGAVVVVGG